MFRKSFVLMALLAGTAFAAEDARQLAKMPPAMHALGLDGHKAASAFAAIAATGDREKTLAALPTLSGSCVGCHYSYRIR